MRTVSVLLNENRRTLRNGQRRRPLISQNVQADRAVGVDIGVVDLGRERHLWGLERVVCSYEQIAKTQTAAEDTEARETATIGWPDVGSWKRQGGTDVPVGKVRERKKTPPE